MKKRGWSISLVALASCVGDSAGVGGDGPGVDLQRDEVIVIEETVPDCSAMGAGFEPVAGKSGWVCRCTIPFFCARPGGGLESSGFTVGPSSGPGSGPSGSGGSGNNGGAGGAGGSGGSGGSDRCEPAAISACLNDCQDVESGVHFGCATSGIGLSPNSIFCAADRTGECLGSHGLCASGRQPSDYWVDRDFDRHLGGGHSPDKDCWPWPYEPTESRACWKKHEACSDSWFSILYGSEDCWNAASDAGQACMQDCRAGCEDTQVIDNP